MDPGSGVGAWDDEFEKSKEGVKAVLGDVRELGIGFRPPGTE